MPLSAIVDYATGDGLWMVISATLLEASADVVNELLAARLFVGGEYGTTAAKINVELISFGATPGWQNVLRQHWRHGYDASHCRVMPRVTLIAAINGSERDDDTNTALLCH